MNLLVARDSPAMNTAMKSTRAEVTGGWIVALSDLLGHLFRGCGVFPLVPSRRAESGQTSNRTEIFGEAKECQRSEDDEGAEYGPCYRDDKGPGAKSRPPFAILFSDFAEKMAGDAGEDNQCQHE